MTRERAEQELYRVRGTIVGIKKAAMERFGRTRWPADTLARLDELKRQAREYQAIIAAMEANHAKV